ncbi:hypothetical protein WJX79_001565 [Trebouxia sp. C0005]|nr:MAG: hypothetical protein FRX49_02841 [Trebouxia sp. A1-2]
MQALHDIMQQQMDTQREVKFLMNFGMDWWAFLETRHKEVNGQTLLMQEEGPRPGAASGLQTPAPASHVAAAPASVPLTDKQAARSALIKAVLEADNFSTEEE